MDPTSSIPNHTLRETIGEDLQGMVDMERSRPEPCPVLMNSTLAESKFADAKGPECDQPSKSLVGVEVDDNRSLLLYVQELIDCLNGMDNSS